MVRGNLFAVILVLCLAVVSAEVTCNPTYVTQTYTEGDVVSASVQCTNSLNSSSVTITKSGSYFTIDQSSISASPSIPSVKTINIDFDSAAPPGVHSGSIGFSDGSSSIPLLFTILEATPTTLISLPTSKIINVQQGNEYQKKVTMIIPSTYPNPINIQSIEFSEENEIISFGDVETGILNPGDIKDIPVIIHAQEAQVGEYPTISIVIRFDDNGEIVTLSTALHIIVTANLNPTSNVTFSSPPSCSLSASSMNVNNTYSFTCSNVQKNLEVNPVFNEFFEGLNVYLSGSIYTYEFKPIKFGNTEFVSTFNFMGAPLFAPYRQEVRIASSGSGVGGTDLKLLFTPKLNEVGSNEEVVIQLVDEKSGSLVNDPEIYIDAIKLQPINGSENSFPYKLELGENYEVRGTAPGYEDLVETINITSIPLSITINPDNPYYVVGDVLNITANEPNVSILLDNTVITNPYTLNAAGNFLIKVVKEGYISAEKNITVKQRISYQSMTPLLTDWKKGEQVIIMLNENVSWVVEYSEKDGELFLEGANIASGNGDRVEFEINGEGRYVVKSGDAIIANTVVEEGSKWYKPWTWDFFKDFGWKWVWVILVLGIVGYLYFGGNKEKSSSSLTFSPKPQE